MADFDFDVVATPVATPDPDPGVGNVTTRFSPGSTNDSISEIFRKHFNPSSSIQTYEPGWDALIQAISSGDEINFDNGAAAVDQLWIHSASGIFLDRRAADQGVVRPESVGISDEVFRRLTIKTTTKKLVTQALLEAMEVFYGTDSTRANLTCADEPYALETGWELLVSIDGEDPVTIPFVTADFDNINAATAEEVAAVITRWFERNDSLAYALAYVNPLTGVAATKIYSSALGLESSVQVTGGQAQNVLLFPTLTTQSDTSDVWVVSISAPGTVRFLVSGATATDLNLVQEGDYVNIYGANFNTANQGSYPIANVDVRYVAGVLKQYFEIDLNTGVAQASVTMLSDEDLIFFRPTRTTINDNGARAVIVSQTDPGEVRVQLPATTIAVSRGPLTGAYGNVNDSVLISTVVRDAAGLSTISTAAPHGLVLGGQVYLDDIESDNANAAITAGNGTTTTDASVSSNQTNNVAAPGGTKACYIQSLLLSNGDVFSCGGEEFTATADIGPVASSHRLRITTPTVLADTSVRYTYSWPATANMPAATIFHRLALLTSPSQSGNVLSCGGTNNAAVFSTSYIFDVVANAWSASMAMIAPRFAHTATQLDDGRVLATGGQTDLGGTIVATAEVFTPTTIAPGGAWAAVGSMITDRKNHQAVKLASGNVLIIGGTTTAGTTARCELFDPTTNTFSGASPMGYSRTDHRAVMLPNDRVFVWGGLGKVVSSAAADAWLSTAEIYDGRTGRWSPAVSNPNRPNTGNLPYDEITWLAAKNQVIVIGRGSSRIDIYDVATGQWLPSPASLVPASEGVDAPSITAHDTYPIVVEMGGLNSAWTSLLGASLYIAAEDRVGAGGMNGVMHRVASVPSATTFTVETPEFTSYLGDASSAGSMTAVAQVAGDINVPGPFIYDPDHGFSITDISTETTTAISSGTKYRHIAVSAGDASDFPDEEGWLIFGFGTADQTAPVKYIGREDADTLILDFKTTFPVDLPIGTTIVLLDGKGPFVPEDPAAVGSLYITDSSSGRVAASKTLDDIVAAGISLVKTVVYPGDVGMGAASFPVSGQKLSDKVEVWAGNDIDAEMLAGRGSP